MKSYTIGMSFGSDLKGWRKKAGMTQKELATAAGVSTPYISNLERDFSANTRRGKPRASEDLCYRLAKVLQVDLDIVRASAGWLPLGYSQDKPETLQEVLERLERMGIDIQLKEDDLRDAPPEILGEVQDSIKFGIEYILHKHGLK